MRGDFLENWKQWLIVSGVISIILGVIVGIIWGANLYICDSDIDIEPICWANTNVLEAWWIIPLAMIVGFILPYVVWIIRNPLNPDNW
jgi:hypothetical protein